MAPSLLTTAVEQDQQGLLDRLKVLADGKGSEDLRDEFLDQWVSYNSAIGIVLYDAARHHLEEGQALVDELRKKREESDFEQKFGELETADGDAVATVAKRTAPAFRAEAERVMKKLVSRLTKELDDDVLGDLAQEYLRQRSST